MKYIVIENQGEAEPKALRLMGASSKTEDQIGRFGTGWNYGSAGAVRLAGPFPIALGERIMEISRTPVEVRGVTHNELTVDGQCIGITDQLGKDWEPWMVLREFIANAVDEGGHRVFTIDDDLEQLSGSPGLTRVFVPYEPFADVYDNLDDYFCLSEVPGEIRTTLGRAIPKRDKNVTLIFKKGVRVLKVEGSSAFNYELNDVLLGEDRIAKDYRPVLWTFLDNAPLSVKKAVLKSYFEADSYQYKTPNPDWKEAFGDKLVVSDASDDDSALKVRYQFVSVAERVGARTFKTDLAAKAAARETMPATLTVREQCKKLAKLSIDVNPALILMMKPDGDDVLVERGLTYLSKDLGADDIFECLLIAATAKDTGMGSREHLKTLASIVRRSVK